MCTVCVSQLGVLVVSLSLSLSLSLSDALFASGAFLFSGGLCVPLNEYVMYDSTCG